MNSEDEARAALAQRRQEAREADAREIRERYGAMAVSRVSTPPAEVRALIEEARDYAGVDEYAGAALLRQVANALESSAVPASEDVRALGYAVDDLEDGADFQDAIASESIRLVVKHMRAHLESLAPVTARVQGPIPRGEA